MIEMLGTIALYISLILWGLSVGIHIDKHQDYYYRRGWIDGWREREQFQTKLETGQYTLFEETKEQDNGQSRAPEGGET